MQKTKQKIIGGAITTAILASLILGGSFAYAKMTDIEDRQNIATLDANLQTIKSQAMVAQANKKADRLQKKVEEAAAAQKNQISTIQRSAQRAQQEAEKAQTQLAESKDQVQALQAQIQYVQSNPAQTVVVEESNYSASVVSSYIPAIVQLICPQSDQTYSIASGSIATNVGDILTNAHVIGDSDFCVVLVTQDPKMAPTATYFADVTMLNVQTDIAILKITHLFDQAITQVAPDNLVTVPGACSPSSINIGDKMFVVGYPAAGGNSITITDGIIAGFDGGYIKTSAKIDHGNSGGIAFHSSGCVLGIPTAVVAGDLESYGFVIDLTQ